MYYMQASMKVPSPRLFQVLKNVNCIHADCLQTMVLLVGIAIINLWVDNYAFFINHPSCRVLWLRLFTVHSRHLSCYEICRLHWWTWLWKMRAWLFLVIHIYRGPNLFYCSIFYWHMLSRLEFDSLKNMEAFVFLTGDC